MNDEHALLEHRIAWLEREMVRLIWALLSAGSLLSGGAAYRLTVDTMGVFGAIGIAVVVVVIVAWYLHRHEFGGAPEHVKDMDP
jgi:hypothetical protein